MNLQISTSSYVQSQSLGKMMRQSEIDAFAYVSARDPERGTNIGILNPAIFMRNKPIDSQTWKSFNTKNQIEFMRTDWDSKTEIIVFYRSDFEMNGRLPTPAV